MSNNPFTGFQLNVKGGATLEVSLAHAGETLRVTADEVLGDNTGRVMLRDETELIMNENDLIVPFAILALQNTFVRLPVDQFDCEDLDLSFEGTLPALDDFIIGSYCSVRIVHDDDVTKSVQNLDIKSYGEMDILTEDAVTTLLQGEEIDIRSGATVSDVTRHVVYVQSHAELARSCSRSCGL